MKNIFVNSRNQIAELAFVALDTASGSTYVGPQIISSLSASAFFFTLLIGNTKVTLSLMHPGLLVETEAKHLQGVIYIYTVLKLV